MFLKSFTLNICKNVAKKFNRIEHGLKIDSGYVYVKPLSGVG